MQRKISKNKKEEEPKENIYSSDDENSYLPLKYPSGNEFDKNEIKLLSIFTTQNKLWTI